MKKLFTFSTHQIIVFLFVSWMYVAFALPFLVAQQAPENYTVLALGCKEHTDGQLVQILPPGGITIASDSIFFYTAEGDSIPSSSAFISSRFDGDGSIDITGCGVGDDGVDYNFQLVINEKRPSIWILPDGHTVVLALVKKQ